MKLSPFYKMALGLMGKPLYLPSVVLFFFGVVSSSQHDPLRDIRRPYIARFSRLWMVKRLWQGDLYLAMIDLHKNHGKLVRTGPKEVRV